MTPHERLQSVNRAIQRVWRSPTLNSGTKQGQRAWRRYGSLCVKRRRLKEILQETRP